jgi:hypothetical protein
MGTPPANMTPKRKRYLEENFNWAGSVAVSALFQL